MEYIHTHKSSSKSAIVVKIICSSKQIKTRQRHMKMPNEFKTPLLYNNCTIRVKYHLCCTRCFHICRISDLIALRIEREQWIFLIGADGGRDVGAVLFVQRAVNNRTVLQGHLWVDTSVMTTLTYHCSKGQHPPGHKDDSFLLIFLL